MQTTADSGINNMNNNLIKFIKTRDMRVVKSAPYKESPITEYFDTLIRKGSVTVGGRSSCGGKTDPTWIEFTSWNEVVKKANKEGYKITVEPIMQANKSPTMAGGYWYENIYTIKN